MTFLESQNYRDSKKIYAQGVGRGLAMSSTGDFVGQWSCSAWHCSGGQITLCMSHNYKILHQKWALTFENEKWEMKNSKNHLGGWGTPGWNIGCDKRI